jgi:hypothetical protein
MSLRLLTSVVVTNAVVHGGSNICLELCVLPAYAVRVEVFDRSRDRPVVKHPPPDSESGRGLQLVAAMANDWGARRRLDGKIVWFELHDNALEPRQR